MAICDDSGFSVEVLAYLETEAGRGLLEQAREMPDTAGTVERLRKNHSVKAVHVALTLARLREKGAAKFPGLGVVYGPQEAVEQATSFAVGRHKARRFREYLERVGISRDAVSGSHGSANCADPWHPDEKLPSGRGKVLDACCGIGGDAMVLAEVAGVVAVDMSEVRLWCVRANAQQLPGLKGIETRNVDVAGMELAGYAAFHIDPSRRTGGRRHHGWADMVPGPEVIGRLMRGIGAGAIKLSPGVDFAELPAGHLELIGEESSVVQAVLWTGGLAAWGGEGKRTATGIKRGLVKYTFTAAVEAVGAVVPPRKWIGEVEPAVHRAGLAPALAKELGSVAMNADGGLITSDAAITHPAVSGFEHVMTMGFSEKKLKAAMLDLPAIDKGAVEVKMRGGMGVDTDKLQKELTKVRGERYTVLIYTGAEGTMATVGKRVLF